jgi:DNA-binding CsgD family transcriptional regulator
MFATAERVELAALWEELVMGTSKIESWSHDDDSWSVVVSRSPGPLGVPPGGLRHRDIEILEQSLLCGVRKTVAVDVGLSCSSIAVILQSCFQFMGLECLPSRIPGLVVAAAHARRHPGKPGGSFLKAARGREYARHTVTVRRPDAALKDWLAPAELAVIRLLIEGMSYAEIATERKTSIRTVANQIASGFRRVGVSGRAELLCLLVRWGLDSAPPPRRRTPVPPPAPEANVAAARPRARRQRRPVLAGPPSSRRLEEAAPGSSMLSPSSAT